MLFEVILRTTTFMTTFIMLFVGALHLRPYVYTPGFQQVMPAPGCTDLCLWGIQPGVTTVSEATDLLGRQPGITDINLEQRLDGSGQLTWDWIRQYSTLKPIGRNVIWYDSDGIVERAIIPTAAPLFEFRLHYGTTNDVIVNQNPTSRDIIINEVYPGFQLTYSYRCIGRTNPAIYRQPVTLLIEPPERGVTAAANQARQVFTTPPCI